MQLQRLCITMTTSNPRITVTLSPEQHALLREMSRLTQTSQSGLISEILTELSPVWTKMLTVMQAAGLARGAINESFIKDMDKAQAKVEKHLGLTLDAFDEMQLPLLDLVQKVEHRKGRDSAGTRRDADARAAASATPPSNRGVRFNQNTTKTTTYADAPKKPTLGKTHAKKAPVTVQNPSKKTPKKGAKI